MKRTAFSLSLYLLSSVALYMTVPLTGALAQTPPPAAAPPAAAPPQQQDQLLKAEELDALVSPIALYPDTLLAEVLMASTYPLEVIEADRWITANKQLKGAELKAAVDKQTWDESVKSLTVTPSVLNMMSTQLSWTQKLGDAVLAQQPDVMDAVQRLRTKADAQDKLKTTKQQKVSKSNEGGKQVIVIEPAEPDTIYVPYYDPAVVYGGWPYPSYPPYYWPPPVGYYPGAILGAGLAFTAGYALGAWAGNGWGGGVNWGNNNININRNININNGNRGNWTHNPAHRQGVRYNNANVSQRFSNGNAQRGAQQRMDYRGRGGDQVLRPGGGDNRPGAGGGAGANRPGAGGGGAANRPGAGGGGAANRPGAGGGGAANRPAGGGGGAGNRPGGGGGGRPAAATRPAGGGGGGRGNAFGNVGSGRATQMQSSRGQASLGGGGRGGGGGAARGGGGGGGARGGGGGGGGRGGGGGGGGGRRSDIRLKHDIALVGRLDNGLGVYRFSYNGSEKAYVGVMAQEVEAIRPDAVVRGRDGYLRVFYNRLGLKFETYDQWVAKGGQIPPAYRNPSN